MNGVPYYLAATITKDDIGYNGPTNAGSVLGNVINAVYFWMAVVGGRFYHIRRLPLYPVKRRPQ